VVWIPPETSDTLTNPIWQDKRRPVFGKPLSFTKYILYPDRLIIESGLLSIRREEIRLYRIKDITMHQTVTQRLFKVGTLKLQNMDPSAPRCLLRDILMPGEVMQLISDLANKERIALGFGLMEFMNPML